MYMRNRDNGSSISFSCFIKTEAKGFFIEYTSQGKFVQLKKRNRKPMETRSISKETLLRGLKEPSGGNSGNISDCLEFSPFKIEPGCRSFVHCLLFEPRKNETYFSLMRDFRDPFCRIGILSFGTDI